MEQLLIRRFLPSLIATFCLLEFSPTQLMVLLAVIKQELAFAVVYFAGTKVDPNKLRWHVVIILVLLVFLVWLVLVVKLFIQLRALILQAERLLSLGISQSKL